MKTEVISNITKDMKDSLTDYQLNKLKESLIINFKGVEFIIKTDKLKHQEELYENKKMIDSFISSKQVEGCSERTIKYYREIIERFVNSFDKSIKQISTDEIRNYLSKYKDKELSILLLSTKTRLFFIQYSFNLEFNDSSIFLSTEFCG